MWFTQLTPNTQTSDKDVQLYYKTVIEATSNYVSTLVWWPWWFDHLQIPVVEILVHENRSLSVPKKISWNYNVALLFCISNVFF